MKRQWKLLHVDFKEHCRLQKWRQFINQLTVGVWLYCSSVKLPEFKSRPEQHPQPAYPPKPRSMHEISKNDCTSKLALDYVEGLIFFRPCIISFDYAVQAVCVCLFSVQSLQSLMNPKYHKMIRNSAKIQLRRERKRKAEGKLPATSSSCDGGSDDDDASALQNSGRTSSVSGASLKSSKSVSSAVSLSGRIRVQK